ncbi:hypothetical protein CC78DRAFT_531414 [Lojkania enalia]|uniref:Survival Motor Neuron Gemin2-binding domain-containing protein n=1 Tax=Lojkania enalia TaxID=147567 RepID=A0A9P4N5V5_9PLEO|nr:hypothetical protein CC78DRAFT_531414 [Didymosphaeria enalia]
MAPIISLEDKNIWDDTALIKSWDEAVAEYKRYHSIQAEGKRLEEALSEEELKQLREDYGDLVGESEPRSNDTVSKNTTNQEQVNEFQEMPNGGGPIEDVTRAVGEPSTSESQEQQSASRAPEPRHDEAPAAVMPQALLGTVQDGNLRNVMMAWYYAGYYTGLQAGQQGNAPE